LARLLLVLGISLRAIQDQIRKNGLLLLPPGLAIVPHKMVRVTAVSGAALDHVVPSAALLVAANRGHDRGDLTREVHIFVLRTKALHAHEVPGDLQVVANYSTVLLPAPGRVVSPVLEELLLDKRAVCVVLEVLLYDVERILQEIRVF